MEQGAGAEAARHDENVRRRAGLQRMVSDDPEAIAGLDGGCGRDDRDGERGVVREFVRDREHLERTREVEDLNLGKEQQGNGAAHGGGRSEGRR